MEFTKYLLLLLVFCIACSDPEMDEPLDMQMGEPSDTTEVNEPMDTIELTVPMDTMEIPVPADSIEESNTAIYSGAVYMACEIGPYYFTIDSLIANCSQEGGSMDSLTLDQLAWQDSSLNRCGYDSDFMKLAGDPWEFKIERIGNWSTFSFEWQEGAAILNPIFPSIDGQLYEDDQYPFYNGFEVEVGETKLRIMVFNTYIGGCLHDLIVWEYEH